MGRDPVSAGCPKCGKWCFCEPGMAGSTLWEPRFLPGLKRLMNRVVPWLMGDITKPDVQGRACGSGEDIQAAACEPLVEREPCACEKYLFPTFELETLDWSWEPITDDDGIHEPDRCLFGVGDPSIQEDEMRPVGRPDITFTVSQYETELLLDGLSSMINELSAQPQGPPIVADNRRRRCDDMVALRRRLLSLGDSDKPYLSSQTLCGHDWQPWSRGVLHCVVCGVLRADLANRATEERT